MKNIFYILLLLPTIIFAQYPNNSGHKITLGEQTTADGLIWRGVASDTTLTAKSDTSAYFVLDTVNINLYTYKASATGRKWIQVETDSASIAYVNTYNPQTVNGAKTFTSAVTATRFNPTANTATGTGMFAPTSTSLGFSTDGTNKMTLDASGNLGLGITPNLWVGVKAMQLGHLSGLALYGYAGTGAEISSNIFFDGNNYVYTTTNRASRYALSQGQHRWFIAPSGIQDAVISDNQVMTIYTDGNVGINVNIPTEKLHVVGNGLFTGNVGIGSTTNPYNFVKNLTISAGTSGAIDAGLTIQGSRTSNDPFGGIQGYHGTNRVATIFFNRDNNENNSGAISFLTSSSGIIGERMRIASNGNVGIGTASPSARLEINEASSSSILRVLGGGDGTGGGKGNIRSGDRGGTNFWDFGRDNLSTGNFVLTSGGGSPLLSITTTGAATFSSSVTANSLSLTTPLSVANGGTNTSTAFTAGSVVFAGSGGTYTQDNSGLFWDNTNKRLGINDNTPNSIMEVRGTIPAGGGGGGLLFVPTVSNDNTTQYGITTQGTGSGASQFILLGLRNGNVTTKASGIWLEPTQPGLNIGNAYTLIAPSNGAAIQGETWIGYTTDQGAFPLQVNGSIYAAGTTYPSDERYKENIIPLNKGLDLINKLKPVTFNYINTTENNFSEFEEVGFIAQDVDRALSTELFVKSIVKYTDESNTDSKMVFSPQNLIPILTKAIQEQTIIIKQLEERIKKLEER